jgi:hypothetical protein
MTSGNRRLRSERKFLVNPLPLPFSPQPSQSIPNRVSSETDIHPFQFAILNKEGALIASALSSFTTKTNITRHTGLFMQACTCIHAPAAIPLLGILSYLTPANSKIWRDFLTIPLKTINRKSGGGVPPLRARKLPDSNSSIRQFNNSSIYLTSLFSHE